MSDPLLDKSDPPYSNGHMIMKSLLVVFLPVALGPCSLAYLTSRSHSHFFLLQHSILYLRIFKLEFYFMKKCSCRESNSRLLIERTASYPPDHQDNDAGKCNFLVSIF